MLPPVATEHSHNVCSITLYVYNLGACSILWDNLCDSSRRARVTTDDIQLLLLQSILTLLEESSRVSLEGRIGRLPSSRVEYFACSGRITISAAKKPKSVHVYIAVSAFTNNIIVLHIKQFVGNMIFVQKTKKYWFGHTQGLAIRAELFVRPKRWCYIDSFFSSSVWRSSAVITIVYFFVRPSPLTKPKELK